MKIKEQEDGVGSDLVSKCLSKKIPCAGLVCHVIYVTKILKTTQLIFTCSKSTIETVQEGVKYVQS